LFFYTLIEMNKNLILVLFILLCSCNTNSFNNDGFDKEEVILSNQELLIKQYQELIIPLFKSYSMVDIPTEFQVDPQDTSINAGASFGFIEVSQGLVDAKMEAIRVFVLAHEVAHLVTIAQARLFSLEGPILRGTTTNDYKKSEYLADLIALHLIQSKLTKEFEYLLVDFDYLQQLLGSKTFTHPSGVDRILFLKEYLSIVKEKNEATAFRTQFLCIWKME
jgi:hypothetical protein